MILATAESIHTLIGGNGVAHGVWSGPYWDVVDAVRLVDIALCGLIVGRIFVGLSLRWIRDFWRQVTWFGVLFYSFVIGESGVASLGYPVGHGGRLWLDTIGVVLFFGASARVMAPRAVREARRHQAPEPDEA